MRQIITVALEADVHKAALCRVRRACEPLAEIDKTSGALSVSLSLGVITTTKAPLVFVVQVSVLCRVVSLAVMTHDGVADSGLASWYAERRYKEITGAVKE